MIHYGRRWFVVFLFQLELLTLRRIRQIFSFDNSYEEKRGGIFEKINFGWTFVGIRLKRYDLGRKIGSYVKNE